MSITPELRERVRLRAGLACEYCGVTETDAAGLLTVDHFRPQSRGGTDDPDNLIYCCHRCNGYKADYWPQNPESPTLWNPRHEPAGRHLEEQADGSLSALSPAGAFTLRRLRLNRPPLVAYRLRRRQAQEEAHLLMRLRDALAQSERLSAREGALLEEQRALLQEQQRLLRLLLDAPDVPA